MVSEDLGQGVPGWEDLLLNAFNAYGVSRYDDEVFDEVGASARAQGEVGKTGVAALATWKRIRVTGFAGKLMGCADAEVRRFTREAFAEGLDDRSRFSALSRVPGCGNWGPVATTVLSAWWPEEHPVMDEQARWALRQLRLAPAAARTVSYVHRLRSLRDHLNRGGDLVWRARDVDKALFVYGA